MLTRKQAEGLYVGYKIYYLKIIYQCGFNVFNDLQQLSGQIFLYSSTFNTLVWIKSAIWSTVVKIKLQEKKDNKKLKKDQKAIKSKAWSERAPAAAVLLLPIHNQRETSMKAADWIGDRGDGLADEDGAVRQQ